MVDIINGATTILQFDEISNYLQNIVFNSNSDVGAIQVFKNHSVAAQSFNQAAILIKATLLDSL